MRVLISKLDEEEVYSYNLEPSLLPDQADTGGSQSPMKASKTSKVKCCPSIFLE
jgi:hypothetical protein